MNTLKLNSQILHMMSNYKDVDTELTRISASLSDHVFIGKEVKKMMFNFLLWCQNLVITILYYLHYLKSNSNINS